MAERDCLRPCQATRTGRGLPARGLRPTPSSIGDQLVDLPPWLQPLLPEDPGDALPYLCFPPGQVEIGPPAVVDTSARRQAT
jgi:hypothetical protein